MGESPQAVRAWVREKLIREAGENGPPATMAAAAEHILRPLSAHLARLVGDAGFEALLARAVALARREVPALCADPGGGQEGLVQCLREMEGEHVCGSATAVVTALVDLLASFVGVDLATSLLREAWPDLPEMGDGAERAGDT
ncbi:MAG: hypothetical protein HY321_08950 [Armatimonadetes bacterium]|nr:hypothetical protein [Armatimonadota bacterium]